ncbi:MAG: FTR1 family iron permease [Clostridia bacterium]|nr:FTR1 family iron permease [Clostridia bacterium]
MRIKRGMALLAAFLLALGCVTLPGGNGARATVVYEEGNRWGSAATEIDKLADEAFELYLAGKAGEAYKNVSDAYFQIYEITGFERQTLTYISGPRKNAVELQFSTCKAAVKKPNDDPETQKEVRTELVKLKTMIRTDANKLAAKDGEPETEMTYWLSGSQVASEPWPELVGDPNAKVMYPSWTAAFEAMDELLTTASTGYNGRDFEAALDNVNTAFYTVYEESGLDHAIYSDMSIEDREAVDEQFATVKGIAARGAEKFESKKFKREIKALKTVLSAKAASLDEKKAAEEAEKAAAAAEAAGEAAETETAQSDPRWLTFLGAFGIIVREGLEAILVIAAIIAYLVKSGNGKSLRNVYIGALLGIVASFIAAAVLAWAKQAFVGAGMAQEVIEGITALIAVCVLFYVSNWMISKAEAASWSHYIDSKVQSGVERNSAFALAFTAFLSVFREGAEVVLFYQPMLSEGNAGMVWAGFGAGCVLLVFVYLAITKLSIKLPIKVFFTATSILMAVMCVAFLGSGIKELAEGNVFDVTMYVTGIPENDVIQIFGIYPYLETLVPQLILAVILLITFMIAHYRGKIAAIRAEYEARGREPVKA